MEQVQHALEWPYRPQPGPQDELWKALSPQSSARYIGFGGPRGGGKSFGMRSWFVTACWTFPIEAAIVRRKRSDLVDNHINAFKLEMKPFIEAGYLKYNERDAAAYFKNGSILYFNYCDSLEDLESIQGKAYDLLGIEESTQLEEHYINVMISSNRPSNVANKFRTKYRPKALQTFNWGGRSHEFHRRIFWDKVYTKDEDPQDYHFIFAPLKYNTILLDNDPNYAKQLKRLPPQLQKAWIDGDPDAFTGSMFKIVEEFHVVDQDEMLDPFNGVIPSHWKLFGSLDAATGDYCSFGLYTKSPGGFIYKIFTYYIKGLSPQDHVDAITERVMRCPYTDGRKPSYILADRHAFQRRSKTMIGAHDITWKDLFADRGLHLQRAVDDRIAGAMAMVHALDYKYDYDNKMIVRSPKLQFFKEHLFGTNAPTIKELLALERDRNNPEDIDQNSPDHAYDETRYAVMGALTPREMGQKDVSDIPRHTDYGSHVPIEEKLAAFDTVQDEWDTW